MKLFYKQLLFIIILALLLTGCSRKNDTFLSRNFHAVTTEYNTLYNGQLALDLGRSTLVETFKDDYWDILPIERIVFDENAASGEENRDENFLRAEEKAIKAIQKHAMKIDGEERNPQIDEAFLLLGKARYYDQQFVPALEAFNYVLAYYPKSNNVAQAKVWKEKTNIRLDNNEIAIENLAEIFKAEKKLKDQDIADAHAMLAQAYLNLEVPDSALAYIQSASNLTKKNEERGRYNYIKGQLYNKLGKKDSANLAFQEVIDLNRKVPRKYHINAHLEQVYNFDYGSGDTLVLRERLDKMAINRENRPFLNKIYYAKATYFMAINKEDSAIANYNKSLRTQGEDEYLNSRDYLALADYNFDNAAYKVAGAYYDSVIGKLSDRTREYRIIRKKRENLTDVIDYEDLTQRNDSILRLAKMSDEDINTYFEDYIAKLKEKATQDSLARIEEVRNNEFFTSNSNTRNTSQATVGGFYFYNDVAVAYGKQSFEKQWGKRKLEDGWRLSSRQNIPLNSNQLPGVVDNVVQEEVVKKTAADYIATVPREAAQIDSLSRERDFAYFQLGIIYKEKFKEYPLAADRLEKLLTFEPEENLVLPAKYNLYQIYGKMDAFAKAESSKTDITSNYPDSRYAFRILNPDTALQADADAPEEVYKQVYGLFQKQDFVTLLPELDRRIDQFYGDPYLPKFELLKATALGRYEGFEVYKTALNYVALTYPRTEEGKKAQSLIQEALPSMDFSNFDDEELSINYKVLYPFQNGSIIEAQEFEKQLLEAFELVNYENFEISLDVYNPEQFFLVIHYITSRSQGEGLVELLETNEDIIEEDLLLSRPNTIIASENYKIIQLHKNVEDYISTTTN